MRKLVLSLVAAGVCVSAGAQTFAVRFPAAVSGKALDGRLMVLLSNDPSEEPRFQINDTMASQQVFGVTVDGWKPGQTVVVADEGGDGIAGYPRAALKDVPPGDYTVQAVLNVYETFHRGDGSVVKLSADRGEGKQWSLAPGNLYSKPVKMHVGPGAKLEIVMDQVMPEIKPVADSKYIRHIKIQSALLTKFWGRPVYLSAVVMVPWGFDEHPEARFPLVISEDHYTAEFDDFRTEPPDPNLKPVYSDRFHLAGYNRIMQEEAYKNYQEWIAPKTPRM
jgi:hypothetical protein